MKIYIYNTSKLPAFLKNTFSKLRIRSVLTLLILFVHQSLFAQVAEIETGSFAYSDFLVVVLVLLIATIFIGLEIYGDPKYESLNQIQSKPQTISDLSGSIGYVFEKNISTKLRIAIFSVSILLVMYAVLVFFMF